MALLEKQFRNRFRARAGGYVFRQWGHDVVFTAEEYQGFVAERNRLWSGWTFGVYLALGVAAPLWMWRSDLAVGAVLLASVALAVLGVILIHGERLPNGVAGMRVPNGEGVMPRERYTPEEYDALLEKQRNWWRKPGFWFFILLYGTALPISLVADGDIWLAGFCAAATLGVMIYSAIDGPRAPARTAQRRARGEPEPEKPVIEPLWSLAWLPLAMGPTLWRNFAENPASHFYSRWFVLLAFLSIGWLAVDRFLRLRQLRTA